MKKESYLIAIYFVITLKPLNIVDTLLKIKKDGILHEIDRILK